MDQANILRMVSNLRHDGSGRALLDALRADLADMEREPCTSEQALYQLGRISAFRQVIDFIESPSYEQEQEE